MRHALRSLKKGTSMVGFVNFIEMFRHLKKKRDKMRGVRGAIPPWKEEEL